MSIKINDTNFEVYKRVFEILSKHLLRELLEMIPVESDPVRIINDREKKSKPLAIRSLNTGLNDLIASLKYSSPERLEEINTFLESENLPNLRVLLDSVNKTKRLVLKSKRIKNEEQYYIIKEILSDMEYDISNDDKNTLSSCLLTYETETTNR